MAETPSKPKTVTVPKRSTNMMTMNDAEKMVNAKLKAFEAQLVADKRIQPAPE